VKRDRFEKESVNEDQKKFYEINSWTPLFMRPFLPLLIGGWLDSNPQTRDK
jgi:hypothetical protein